MPVATKNANAVRRQFVAKSFGLFSFPYPFLCTNNLPFFLHFLWELFIRIFFLLPFAFILSPHRNLDVANQLTCQMCLFVMNCIVPGQFVATFSCCIPSIAFFVVQTICVFFLFIFVGIVIFFGGHLGR